MIKEIAVITIDPGEAEDFEKTYLEVAPVLRRQPGYRYDELLKAEENDHEYILIVHWDTIQSHKDFMDSADFALLADPWGPFQKNVELRHCRIVAKA